MAACAWREAIAGDFIPSEFVHELHHDGQNRIARFRAVEQGKVRLVAGGSAVGWDWRGYLKDQGVDLQEHDRRLLQADSSLAARVPQAS